MTSTLTAEAHRRRDDDAAQARLEQDRAKVAHDARLVVAERSADAAELRSVGLMLGLLAVDPETGKTVTSDPWDEEPGSTPGGSPRG